jgi:hypothetical protein
MVSFLFLTCPAETGSLYSFWNFFSIPSCENIKELCQPSPYLSFAITSLGKECHIYIFNKC